MRTFLKSAINDAPSDQRAQIAASWAVSYLIYRWQGFDRLVAERRIVP